MSIWREFVIEGMARRRPGSCAMKDTTPRYLERDVANWMYAYIDRTSLLQSSILTRRKDVLLVVRSTY